MKTNKLFLLFFLTFHLANNSNALAQAGSLDLTFGTDGIVINDIGSGDDYGGIVGTQSDGKILVAGMTYNAGTWEDFLLIRYNTDGSFDNTFGSAGIVTTSFTNGSDWATSMVIQADGKIILAGEAESGLIAVARYNTDGSLDNSFGTAGKLTFTVGPDGYSWANAVALQSDGKIVIVGVAGNGTTGALGGSNWDFCAARLNTDGSFDTSFGVDGKVLTPVDTYEDEALSFTIQPDGKMVLVGHSHNGTTYDLSILRYNTDGSLDTSFDSDGKLILPIGSQSLASDVELQSDGKIVVSGRSRISSSVDYDFTGVRFNTDGSLDNSFGTGGIVITDVDPSDDMALGMAIQADGKIIFVGRSSFSSSSDFVLTRYNTDGSLDASFGNSGIIITPITNFDDIAVGITIQTDGKILVAGLALVGSFYEVVLARYLPETLSLTDEFAHTSNTISVFPCPFSIQTTILSEKNFDNATLIIQNSIGQTVATLNNLNGNSINVDRGTLTSGMYVAIVMQDNQIIANTKLTIVD